MMKVKELKFSTRGVPASDGAGVKLTRLIGNRELNMLDPFLLLDSFESDQSDEYLAGFPPHPHRGFETVTYMLSGKMRHKDSAGNEGVIEPGGVQWMTAGSGIIHSEMPEQTCGLMHGFQLWINLPSNKKMISPKYQEYASAEIAVDEIANVCTTKVIAGETDKGVKGVINNEFVAPYYLDVQLIKSKSYSQSVPQAHNTLLYVISGSISVGSQLALLEKGQLGVLASGDQIKVLANEESRFIVLSAKPLAQPVARGGPFVMNTKEEVDQAFIDYQRGNFIR